MPLRMPTSPYGALASVLVTTAGASHLHPHE